MSGRASGRQDSCIARALLIIALLLSYAQFAILLNSVGTVILQAIAGFGATKRQAATLEAFKDIPIAVVSLIVAGYLPAFGIRRALMGGQVLIVAGCLLMVSISGIEASRILFLLVGIGFALTKAATYTAIGLVTDDPARHAALTNRIEGGFMIGVLAGYWLFGLFIDQHTPGDPQWLNVYWVLSAVSVLLLVLLAVVRLDESAMRGAHSSTGAKFAAMGRLALLRPVMMFAGAAFVYVLIEQSLGTWLPTFNAEVLRLSGPMSVQAASLFAAALAVGRLGAAPLVARVGLLPVLTVCIAGIAVVSTFVVPIGGRGATATVARWAELPWYGYATPMIGLFLAPVYPTIVSMILSALPRPDHPAMTGLIIGFSALGGTAGSFITGRVFAAFGGVAAFRLVILPTIALGLIVFLLDRRLCKDRLSLSKEFSDARENLSIR